MTTLKSSKEPICPVSDTVSVKFHVNKAANCGCDDYNFSETPDIAASNFSSLESTDLSSECDSSKCHKLSKSDHAERFPPLPYANHPPEKFSCLHKSNDKIEKVVGSFFSPVKSSSLQASVADADFENVHKSTHEYHSINTSSSGKTHHVLKNYDSSKENVNSKEIKEFSPSFGKQSDLFMRKNETYSPNQMKTKLRSMWNNVKYGWRVKREVNIRTDSAAWLLGRYYHNKLNDVSKHLKLDLLSKIWLTYRINFPLIPGTEFVSDSGWGCMLRCGQMMMAQALMCHFLHRDWRIVSDQPDESRHVYKMILRWFGDSFSDACPFSLHHLVSLGEKYGRKAGDWYGPTHASQALRDALHLCQKTHLQLNDICMYVAVDGIVFKQDIEDLCHGLPKSRSQSANKDEVFVSSEFHRNSFEVQHSLDENTLFREMNSYRFDSVKDSDDFSDDACPSYSEFGPPSFNTAQRQWKSLILFVSVRLGNDKINPFYIPCLKSLLTYEQCIGIIGGRPKHALYFIGWQDDKMIHLDPHSCQPAVDVEKEDFSEKSFHSSSIRMISFSEMDPSCAIGFYFKKEEEFLYFVQNFPEITASLKRNLDYPIFALVDGRRADVEEVDSYSDFSRSNISTVRNSSCKDADDDYILL